ncbi:MAG: hypothetical protein ACLGQH_02720, partial [Acidobacteriota bacterium]
MRILFKFLLATMLCLALGAPAAAGSFGTLRDGGVWWLTLPGGPRFFSIGADTVNGGDKKTCDRGYYYESCYLDQAAWAADTQQR